MTSILTLRETIKVKPKKSENRDFARELKKLWNIKAMLTPIVIGAPGAVTKGLVQRLEDLEISGDHRKDSITEIDQNTQKSTGDSRRFAVILSQVENHLLT